MKTSAKMTFHPRTVGLLVTVLLAAGSLSSCTNEQKAKSALLDAGYHPIEVKGYGWFQCSEDDVFATRFKAWSADSSRVVTGCVCQGWFKGSTIRLD